MKDEHIKAKRWRERRELTVEEVAEKTGFSVRAVYKFESGVSYGVSGLKKDAQPIPDESWRRYRMACAGVQAELGGWKFNW